MVTFFNLLTLCPGELKRVSCVPLSEKWLLCQDIFQTYLSEICSKVVKLVSTANVQCAPQQLDVELSLFINFPTPTPPTSPSLSQYLNMLAFKFLLNLLQY